MLSPVATKILNVTFYEIGWFFCVLGGAWDYPLAGALFALALCAVHLFLSKSRSSEAKLMLTACLLGVIIDSAQQALGLFTFKSNQNWVLWLPPWVFVIWAQFATLFRYALFWLKGRYFLAALFGSLGGPLAYWAGIRLGAASFGPDPVAAILCLGVVWAVVIPALCYISCLIDDKEGTYRWPSDLTR